MFGTVAGFFSKKNDSKQNDSKQKSEIDNLVEAKYTLQKLDETLFYGGFVSHYYCFHPVDIAQLITKINTLVVEALLQQSTKTRQNIAHLIFSLELFRLPVLKKGQRVLMQANRYSQFESLKSIEQEFKISSDQRQPIVFTGQENDKDANPLEQFSVKEKVLVIGLHHDFDAFRPYYLVQEYRHNQAITIEAHRELQLSRLGEAIIALLIRLTADELYNLLTQRDQDNRTPIFYLFTVFAVCVKKSTITDNKNHQALWQLLAKIGKLQEPALREILNYSHDGKGTTLRHYLLHYDLLGTLRATKWFEVLLQFPDAEGRTSFHLLYHSVDCSKSEDVEALLMAEQFKTKQRMLKCDNKGLTPLHYACLSGQTRVVKTALEGFTSEEIQEMILAEAAGKITSFHIACKHGDEAMLSLLIAALDLETLYKLVKTNNNVLEKLISKNLKLSHANLHSLTIQRLALFNIYKFFEEIKIPLTADFIVDFANCLVLLARGQQLTEKKETKKETKREIASAIVKRYTPEQRYKFLYDHLRNANISPEQIKEFRVFLRNKENIYPLAKELLSKYKYQKVLLTQPSQNLQTTKTKNNDDCFKLRAPKSNRFFLQPGSKGYKPQSLWGLPRHNQLEGVPYTDANTGKTVNYLALTAGK